MDDGSEHACSARSRTSACAARRSNDRVSVPLPGCFLRMVRWARCVVRWASLCGCLADTTFERDRLRRDSPDLVWFWRCPPWHCVVVVGDGPVVLVELGTEDVGCRCLDEWPRRIEPTSTAARYGWRPTSDGQPRREELRRDDWRGRDPGRLAEPPPAQRRRPAWAAPQERRCPWRRQPRRVEPLAAPRNRRSRSRRRAEDRRPFRCRCRWCDPGRVEPLATAWPARGVALRPDEGRQPLRWRRRRNIRPRRLPAPPTPRWQRDAAACLNQPSRPLRYGWRLDKRPRRIPAPPTGPPEPDGAVRRPELRRLLGWRRLDTGEPGRIPAPPSLVGRAPPAAPSHLPRYSSNSNDRS